jgi:hypothetical protein
LYYKIPGGHFQLVPEVFWTEEDVNCVADVMTTVLGRNGVTTKRKSVELKCPFFKGGFPEFMRTVPTHILEPKDE